MNKSFIAMLAGTLVVAGTVGGCAMFSTTQTNDVKRGLTVAHVLHDAVALSLSAATKSGVLHGPTATTARTELDASEKLLTDADKASDPNDIAADIAAATSLLNDAKGYTQ